MHLDAITLQEDLREANGDPINMARAIARAVETAAVDELASKVDLATLEVRLIKWVVATNAAGVLALAGLIVALT